MTPHTNQPVSSLGVLSLEEMRRALDNVLSSKYFANAPMKQRFLRLICEFHLNGKGTELNEYLIGQEVFDRNQSYNPATDPIVRVGAHGIREKLTLYYQKEGANDEIKIEIPIGSYEPVFVRNPQKCVMKESSSSSHAWGQSPPRPINVDESSANSLQKTNEKRWMWIMAAALIVLGIITTVLFNINQRLRLQVDAATSSVTQARSATGVVWVPFLRTNEPTLLVLSNPIVHRPVNTADPDALTRRAINLTPEQASIMTNAAGNRLPLKTNRPLQLVPAFNTYTGIGEAVGVYRLSALLHSAGETTILKQSRSISPDDLKSYDVILLGSVYANQWSKPLSIKENFVYTTRSTIENLSPMPGEEREYTAAFNQQTGTPIEDHALITVVPSVLGEKTVMVLAGIYSEGTEAAAEFVTDPNHLNELNQALYKIGGPNGPPPYFQALLKVRVENAFPTKISLVTVRELHANGQ